MKQYQNYVFDLYGTLVDIHTDENKKELWEHMSLFFGYYGACYAPEELKEAYLSEVRQQEMQMRPQDKTSSPEARYAHEAYPEIPIEKVFRQLYEKKQVNPDESLVLHTGQMFRVFSTEHIRLYAHARQLLIALKEAGKNVYLLSNAQRIFTEYELRYLGIADCFDGVLISSDHGCKKPDRRFFQLLTDKYGLNVKESLMIGNDLRADIAGARAAGMDGFYIHSAISPVHDIIPADADFYFMRTMNLRGLERRLLAP